jgi:hypothetical protein
MYLCPEQAYKTVNGDSERYNDRLAEIAAPKEGE